MRSTEITVCKVLFYDSGATDDKVLVGNLGHPGSVDLY